MRKKLVLGLLLLIGAAGLFGYRWVVEPARHGWHQGYGSRTFSQPGSFDSRGGGSRSGGGRSLSSLQIFDVVVNVLNVVVGVVGIWLAIVGMRMQRSAGAPRQLRTDT